MQVGPMRLKHRIVMPPHGQYYSEANQPSERQIAYYRERAKGGAASLGVEATWGDRHNGALAEPYPTPRMTAYERRTIPAWARLAEAVHEYDCRLVVELGAAGVNDFNRLFIDNWHPAMGPSRVPSPVMNESPVPYGEREIAEIVGDFGQSAANMREAGLDGIELHGAHGYAAMQFLSPIFNRRTDRYGGSPENRTRFLLEIAQSIRDRVGGELALGVRMTWNEFLGEAGITPALSEEYLRILHASGLFDYFNISCGGYHSLHYSIPGMTSSVEEGFLVPYAAAAREIVGDGAKVMVVGRIRDFELAEQIVAQGAADVICMMRAQMAEPFLVRKIREGREDEITHCVGANQCIASTFLVNAPLTCAVNPVTGRERQWGDGTLARAARPRRVAVVGAGPAGLRCAGTAARRGHDVVVFERDAEPGGHLDLLKRLPGRGEWQRAIDSLVRPLGRLGVELRLGEEASPGSLEDFETVVVATGSEWDGDGYSVGRPERDAMPGAEQEHVLDVGTATGRALEDPAALGRRVLILDDTGSALPIGLADVLAQAGVEVEVVSRHQTVAAELGPHLESAWVLPRVLKAGARLTPSHFVESIDGSTVHLYNVWTREPAPREKIDTVVLALLRSPRDGLYEALGERRDRHRIGDALAPRKTADAIYDGEKLGREL